MRFIGSKVLLLEEIDKVIKENIRDNSKIFCDIFSGTSCVGRYFKKDYTIISNDLMYFSYVLQRATIQNNKLPKFTKLKKKGINDPIEYLEKYDISKINFRDNEYFVSNNYAPSEKCERMYLTQENANRIDFIRLQIEEWKTKNLITENEYFYLLGCLIESIPFVSNITGTYGAYLKHWDNRALGTLEVERLDVTDNKHKNKCYNRNSNELIKEIKGDILYIDPPYNERQYVPNYHVLETVALNDYPEIKGVTGLRDYTDKKSKYCVKKSVKEEFEELIANAKFKHIVISYSTDGIMTIEEIEAILKKHCKEDTYKLYKVPYRKYKSKHIQITDKLSELIFYIEKEVVKEKKVKPKTVKDKSKVQELKEVAVTGLAEINTISNEEIFTRFIQTSLDEKLGIKSTQNKKVKKEKKPKDNFIKSPLNYVGGKYKLLKQIVPYFPNNINTFLDLFTGGLNVGINVRANKTIANDYNHFIIDIFKEFKEKSKEEVLNHIEGRIKEYKLSKTNEDGFLKFREFYNNNKTPLDLYTLVCFSYNYQYRFNNKLDYNNPFGRNRSQFSNELKKKLEMFLDELKAKDIEITCQDYINFYDYKYENNDFVYCDPPYLITTGSYNDGNRGFKNWGEKEEKELLKFLDHLNSLNVKFALSNVLEHKGKSNDILKEWAKKYTVIELNHNYANSSHNTSNENGESREVLIINYQK